MADNYRTIIGVSAALAVALAVLAVAGGSTASAVTYTVTKTADTNDGACNGDCSLREAIIASNADATTSDTITLGPGTYTLTIGGVNEDNSATGDLDIRNHLVTINGAGAGSTIITASGLGDRVLQVGKNVTGIVNVVTISNLTVTGGSSASGNGGGIWITNSSSNITLAGLIVTGNYSGLSGGGISNAGNTTIANSTISENDAYSSGGGINNASPGQLTVVNSTIGPGNTAITADGGGVSDTYKSLYTNVTISGNNVAAAGGNGGGGIRYHSTTDPNTSSTLINVTISNNVANVGAGLSNTLGSGQPGTKMVVANSITAGNSGNNCNGSINSAGDNLDSGTTCGFTQPSDIQNGNAALSGLANNGGATLTHAIAFASQARDNDDNADCPATDQRGYTRNIGPCDYGAYEYGAGGGGPTPTLTPTPTATTTPTPTLTPTPTATPPPDADGDGVSDAFDNCPYWDNADQLLPSWSVPAGDPDCDGFTTAHESFAGTDPFDQCPGNTGGNNEAPDAWPTDNDDNKLTSLADVQRYLPVFNSSSPGPPYQARFDINASGTITLADVQRFLPYFNKTCTGP